MSGKSATELSAVAQTANTILEITGEPTEEQIQDNSEAIDSIENGRTETHAAIAPLVQKVDGGNGEDDIQSTREALAATVHEMRNSRTPPMLGIHQGDLMGFPDMTGLPAMDPTMTDMSALLEHSGGFHTPRADFDFGGEDDDYYDALPPKNHDEKRIQAFAKLEFEDGQFYMNTYAIELGRDVKAEKDAKKLEIQATQEVVPNGLSSSGGHVSQNAHRVRPSDSGIFGEKRSVISEKGGIIGIDPEPQRRKKKKSKKSGSQSKSKSGSTNSSSNLVSRRNAEQPKPAQKDYQTLAMRSLYDVARPVDTENLLPSPDAVPLIPIHPPATFNDPTAGFKGISRVHIKIGFNFQKHLFEAEIKGRNGAFIDEEWYGLEEIVPLKSGSTIQIGGVGIRFLLPDVALGETGAEGTSAYGSSPVDEEEADSSSGEAESEEIQVERDTDENELEEEEAQQRSRPGKGKSRQKGSESQPQPKHSPEQLQPSAGPPKKRGPGRPPKDGISSKRQKAEEARAAKLAAKKEANGGHTPPPTGKGKLGRPRVESLPPVEVKPEKRKYTKRKKMEADQEASVEPEPVEMEDTVVKDSLPKHERSPSPDYGREEDYTLEQLMKPKDNYQYLVYELIKETPPHKLDLKDIYRGLKKKYPYFVFKVDTQGWQSSVRHNLNQNSIFQKLEKSGKGWLWGIAPGQTLANEKRRRVSPPPPHPAPSQLYPPQGPQLLQYPPPNTAMAPFPHVLHQYPSRPNGVPPSGPHPGTPLAPPTPTTYISPYAPAPPDNRSPLPQQHIFAGQPHQYQPGPSSQPAPTPPPPTPAIWPTAKQIPASTVKNIHNFKSRLNEMGQESVVDSALDRAMGFKDEDEEGINASETALVGIWKGLLDSWGWTKAMAQESKGIKRPRESDDEDDDDGENPYRDEDYDEADETKEEGSQVQPKKEDDDNSVNAEDVNDNEEME